MHIHMDIAAGSNINLEAVISPQGALSLQPVVLDRRGPLVSPLTFPFVMNDILKAAEC